MYPGSPQPDGVMSFTVAQELGLDLARADAVQQLMQAEAKSNSALEPFQKDALPGLEQAEGLSEPCCVVSRQCARRGHGAPTATAPA